MKIQFKRLSISNFLSIGNAELDLSEDDGFVLIDAENHRVEDASASNGSGKSSIFESLIWALTGETIRGYKDVVNRYQENDCIVTVEFAFKDHEWKVSRTRSKKGAQNLFIYKDGKELEYKGLRDAEQVLGKELPELTSKFLNSTVVLGQGLPQRFTNNSPAGRKAVLEELSNADYMIEHVKENIKNRENKVSGALQDARERIVAADSKISVNTKILNTSVENLNSLKSVDKDKLSEELSNLILEGRSQAEKVEALTQHSNDLDKQRVELLNKKSELQEKKSTETLVISKKYSNLKLNLDKEKTEALSKLKSENLEKNYEFVNRRTEIRKKIDHSKSIIEGGFCKACGRKFDNVSEEDINKAKFDIAELETEYKKVEEESDNSAVIYRTKVYEIESEYPKKLNSVVSNEREENDKISFKYRDKLKELDEALEKSDNGISELKKNLSLEQKSLQTLRDTYVQKKTYLEGYLKNIKDLEDSINSTKSEIDTLTKNKTSAERDYEDYTARLKVLKSFETFASRDFRGILLEDIVDQLDALLKGYAAKVFGAPLTNFYQEGNSIGIQFDSKEYESLSGGEKQKLDALIQLSLRDLIIRTSGIETNILVTDELFDAIDGYGCEKLLDVITDLGIQTFSITHRQELNIPYDRRLLVVKEPDGIAHIEIA